MGAKSYPLQGLPENEALSLLMRMSSKQEHEWKNGVLEDVGKAIVRKCRHVPLAIRTIGRMLARTENTEADWIVFKTRELSKIDDQEETDILPTLKLCYDTLPSHLKQCFTYCSVFPKDYNLKVDELIDLWIAQGFIASWDNSETREDAGLRCFKELVWRSFFQDLVEDAYGRISSCKMHGLMHDLAKSVVGNDCVIIANRRDFILEGSRHIYVVDQLVDFKRVKGEGHNKIKSLLSSLTNEWVAGLHHLKTITSQFRNLRALQLRLKIVPDSIDKLKHLRFLDLSSSMELVTLPNSIGSLPNLETLNLSGCSRLRELPRGITKLINLRNLDISSCDFTHIPKGISRLTSLQVLSDFVVGKKGNRNAAGIDELSKLQGLKGDLTIQRIGRLDNVWRKSDDCLFLLQNLKLRSLWLSCGGDDREFTEGRSYQEAVLERLQPHSDLKGLTITGYIGLTFPAWLASQLHQLVELEIWECRNCKRLPPVHQLPSLKKLVLDRLVELEFIESGGNCSAFFPSLEYLSLFDLPKFEGWKRTAVSHTQVNSVQEEEQQDSMIPVLPERIVCNIDECPRFSYMSGQHLSLSSVTEKVLQRLGRTCEDLAPPKDEVVKTESFISIFCSVSLNGLKSLCMENARGMEVLQEDFFRSLSSLERLVIRDWPGLKELSGRVILKHLPALVYLDISFCPGLDLSVDEEEDDVKLQQDPVNSSLCEFRLRGLDKMEHFPGWVRHLSKLRKFYIGNCSNLKVVGEEVICSLTSLRELEINSCDGLESLSRRVILHLLTTLESLRIVKYGELDLNAVESNGEDNKANLRICGPTTLRKLTISGVSNLVVVPWWIECLNSLEHLELKYCENMEELPEWFSKLTSLRGLWIKHCGELSRRCRRGGEDCPKISYIPNCVVY